MTPLPIPLRVSDEPYWETQHSRDDSSANENVFDHVVCV
jgi:hypothetical protein